MNVFRCEGCGREGFERRAVCPECFREVFSETDAGEPEALVSSLLLVTPQGFGESYEIVIGALGRTRAFYSRK